MERPVFHRPVTDIAADLIRASARLRDSRAALDAAVLAMESRWAAQRKAGDCDRGPKVE